MTVLSLLIAILSLLISSRDQIVDLFYPRTPLFAAIEASEVATARLVVHNESADSVVVENMMCFLKLNAESDDYRYVDSFWQFEPSSIVAPGSVFTTDIQWMGSGVSENRTDPRADTPIPFEFNEVRRWNSSCACDPERDMDETFLDPVAVCRIYFRSSRSLQNHYDFRAGFLEVLDDIRRQALGLPQVEYLLPDQLEPLESGPL